MQLRESFLEGLMPELSRDKQASAKEKALMKSTERGDSGRRKSRCKDTPEQESGVPFRETQAVCHAGDYSSEKEVDRDCSW